MTQCENCGAPMEEEWCEYCDYAGPGLEGLVEDEPEFSHEGWLSMLFLIFWLAVICFLDWKTQIISWWW